MQQPLLSSHEVATIEIDTARVPYSFSVKLNNKTFVFTLKWNECSYIDAPPPLCDDEEEYSTTWINEDHPSSDEKLRTPYHQRGFFTFDLATTQGEILAHGDPVRYGRPLFGSIEDDRFPALAIVPRALLSDISEVTKENFGKQVKLYLFERRGA